MGEWGQSKELRIMNSHVHIGLYDALREAGASEETARAGAVDIPVGQHLATKEDLLQAIAGVNDRIAKVETGIADLRGELKAEIANLNGSFYRQLWIMAAGIVTVNAGMLTAAVMLSKLFPR